MIGLHFHDDIYDALAYYGASPSFIKAIKPPHKPTLGARMFNLFKKKKPTFALSSELGALRNDMSDLMDIIGTDTTRNQFINMFWARPPIYDRLNRLEEQFGALLDYLKLDAEVVPKSPEKAIITKKPAPKRTRRSR